MKHHLQINLSEQTHLCLLHTFIENNVLPGHLVSFQGALAVRKTHLYVTSSNNMKFEQEDSTYFTAST